MVRGESSNRTDIDKGTLSVPGSRWEPEPWVRTGAVNRATEETRLNWPVLQDEGKGGSHRLQGCCTRVCYRRETGVSGLKQTTLELSVGPEKKSMWQLSPGSH